MHPLHFVVILCMVNTASCRSDDISLRVRITISSNDEAPATIRGFRAKTHTRVNFDYACSWFFQDMNSISRSRFRCSKKLLVFPCCPLHLPSNLFNVYCSFLHARFVSCRPAGSQSSAAQTSSLRILFQNLLLRNLFWIMQKCTCLPTLLEDPTLCTFTCSSRN